MPPGETAVTRNEGADRLIQIVRRVFDGDGLQYDDRLAPGAVQGWDSLSHLRLLAAVEKDFRVRLTSAELDGCKTLGDLLDIIVKRGSPHG